MRALPAAVGVALVLAAAAAGCFSGGPVDGSASERPSPGASATAAGSSPGSVPPASTRSARTPAPVLTAPLGRGAVSVEPGPFTDRVSLTDLTVHPGVSPRVTGRLTVTTDVSEVMALEITADFYDDRGQLVGSATQSLEGPSVGGPEHDDEHGTPSEAVAVDVGPAAPFGREAVSAVVTVPQLVNE